SSQIKRQKIDVGQGPQRVAPYPLATGSSSVSRNAQSIMACQPALMAPGALTQASIISSVGSRIAAMAARARAKDTAVSSNGIFCWSACATRLTMVLIDLYPHEVSAAMEGSARFVVVLLLRHSGLAAAEFSENRDQLFAISVEPIDTYALVRVGVFRDLEDIFRSGVVKFHGQPIRHEDVVGDVTAPLSGDVFICGGVGDVCRQQPTRT